MTQPSPPPTSPPILNEPALRKAGFTDGPRIALGDGQEWTFPRPWIRLYPRVAADGSIEVAGGRSYGDDHEADLGRMFSLIEGNGDQVERIKVRFSLAVKLLLKNYDLDNAALRTLLALAPDEPANVEMWAQVDRVLMGLAPKA